MLGPVARVAGLLLPRIYPITLPIDAQAAIDHRYFPEPRVRIRVNGDFLDWHIRRREQRHRRGDAHRRRRSGAGPPGGATAGSAALSGRDLPPAPVLLRGGEGVV